MAPVSKGQQPQQTRSKPDQEIRRTITISDYLIMTSSPIDTAIYFFICRQFLFTKKPVPFGREDARLLDPELSVGDYSRSIARLEAKGALKRVKVPGSQKNCFHPAWITPTQTILWGTSSATRFDRPQGGNYTPIERHLIDIYLGSYTPQLDGRSTVTRYTTQPMLSLKDVGVYIINRHHSRKGLSPYLPRPYRTPYSPDRLIKAGLCDDKGHFFQVPGLQSVLAAVSQCAFGVDLASPQLNQLGWAALGLANVVEPLSPLEMQRLSTNSASPIFFAPPGMIDLRSLGGSDSMTNFGHGDESHNSLLGSHETADSIAVGAPTWRHDSSRNPHEQTNPPAAAAALAGAEVPVEIYRLYCQLNRKRDIPTTDWETLSLIAEISGGWSNIRSILVAAACRKAGPPSILTPRYISSSLAQRNVPDSEELDSDEPASTPIGDAAVSPVAPSTEDELLALMKGMSQRAKLIREGKATLEGVRAWISVMDLMEQHGMQFSSRPGWLYHQLNAGVEPWPNDQAIKVAQRDKARREEEERQAAERERRQQEEEQRQQEADQTRKNDLILYDA